MYCTKDTDAVKAILDALNIQYDTAIQCGMISIFSDDPMLLGELRKQLSEKNFHIIFDRKSILTEQVKQLLLNIFENDQLPRENYSVFISKRLNLNYNYVATVFSEMEGASIEHFIIEEKVKKAKLLLSEGGTGIGEIALMLHYSSIGHFSNQFKKITGTSPTAYRRQQQHSPITDVL